MSVSALVDAGNIMWIAQLTRLMLALAFTSTVAYVIAFLLASRQIIDPVWMREQGLWLVLVPVIFIGSAWLLRRRASAWMLSRGNLEAVIAYTETRRHASPLVGRAEALGNLYAQGEATRRLGRPQACLILLAKAPDQGRADLVALIALTRAQALAELLRPEEALQALDALNTESLPASARSTAQALRASVQALDPS